MAVRAIGLCRLPAPGVFGPLSLRPLAPWGDCSVRVVTDVSPENTRAPRSGDHLSVRIVASWVTYATTAGHWRPRQAIRSRCRVETEPNHDKRRYAQMRTGPCGSRRDGREARRGRRYRDLQRTLRSTGPCIRGDPSLPLAAAGKPDSRRGCRTDKHRLHWQGWHPVWESGLSLRTLHRGLDANAVAPQADRRRPSSNAAASGRR
ncbi:uncharacterized protein V1510DRAFT_413662 [Dipodascopsis tothii]|uniref:uncharacterized protein n=1 Tax=Dipodascopsis tothii TaxID=44089 RepID=UPI0034CE1925